jgi:dihydroxyacetone kinase
MMAAVEAVDGGAGILFIVKDYTGDVMNPREGCGDGERRDCDGAGQRRRGRRGVAGTIAGAAEYAHRARAQG